MHHYCIFLPSFLSITPTTQAKDPHICTFVALSVDEKGTKISFSFHFWAGLCNFGVVDLAESMLSLFQNPPQFPIIVVSVIFRKKADE